MAAESTGPRVSATGADHCGGCAGPSSVRQTTPDHDDGA